MGEVVTVDSGLTQRLGFIPPYGNGRMTGEPPTPVRKPLIDVKEEWARQWSWTDHAIDRLAERGIGIFEVLSAIYAPDWTTPVKADHKKRDPTVKVVRGDIEVAYRPDSRLIVTVVDRIADRRTKKREPLEPIIVRQGTPFNAHPRNTETIPHDVHDIPIADVVVESQSTVDSPTVEAARKESPVVVKTPQRTAGEAILEWLQNKSADGNHDFLIWDIKQDLVPEGHSVGAIDQAFRTILRSRDAVAPKVAKLERGQYRVFAPKPVMARPVPSPRRPAYVDTTTMPAPVPEPVDVTPYVKKPQQEEVAVSNGHKPDAPASANSGRLELTSVWAEPPTIQRDHDGLIAHINSHLEQLDRRQGQWLMVAKHKSGSAASSRLKTLKDAFPFLKFIQRGGAIYVTQEPEK